MKVRASVAAVLAFVAASLPADEPKPPDWSLRGKALAGMLAELARQQGLDPEDFSSYRSKRGRSTFWGEGDVVPTHDTKYVVAVQSIEATGVPGISAQQVVLLTPDGKILDRLQCDINSRYGRVHASVSRDAEGTRIAILFESSMRGQKGNGWHNWHTIVFRGRSYTFREKATDEHNEWDQGLCRAEVADGKLAVIFPRLEWPEEELARAVSLRISYGERKHLDILDRGQIEALFATMDVEATEPGTGMHCGYNTRIDVRLASGASTRLVFVRPTFLHREEWGRIELGSTAFHDKVAELVAKAEGRPVDIVPHPVK